MAWTAPTPNLSAFTVSVYHNNYWTLVGTLWFNGGGITLQEEAEEAIHDLVTALQDSGKFQSIYVTQELAREYVEDDESE